MSEPICFRCKKPIKGKLGVLLDRKYHYPVCFIVMQQRYFELRHPMKMDDMSLKQVNFWLDLLQWHDPSVHD